MIVVEIGINAGQAFAKPRGYAFPVPALARQIPGVKWDRNAKAYLGSIDAVAAFAFALDEEKLAAVTGSLPYPEEILTPWKKDRKDPPLRDYQKVGAQFLFEGSQEGVMLGDDVGLGKTLQGLTALKKIMNGNGKVERAVIVCPASVKGVWEAETAKWYPKDLTSTVLSGKKNKKEKGEAGNVLILNYEIAGAWLDRLKEGPAYAIAFDEAHYLQNQRSQRSSAARLLAEGAVGKFTLTATPMRTRPRDLWNPIDTVSPGRFGKGPWPFFHRYSNAHQETVGRDTVVWNLDGSSHEDELALRLKFVMLRRSRIDVKLELPERTRQVIPIRVPERAIAPIWNEGKGRRDALSRALTLSGTGKVGEAVELAMSRLAEGHSVCLFSHLKETANRIYERIASTKGIGADQVMLATGDVDPAVRTKVIRMLHETACTKPVVLVATIDSVGTGLDLTFADIAIVVDLHWVPSALLQLEGRLHRFGQTRPVIIYYMVGIGTADEYIQKKVIERLGQWERIVQHAEEASGLKGDLSGFERMSEEEVLADLRRAVIAGEVLPEEDWV